MLPSGCARYQMEVTDKATWRMDTRTGTLEACGYEQGKPVCHAFPAPK